MEIVGFAHHGDAHAGSLDRVGRSRLAGHLDLVPGGAKCPGQRHHVEIVRRLAPGYEQHLHEPVLRYAAGCLVASWRRVAVMAAGAGWAEISSRRSRAAWRVAWSDR